MQWTIRVAVFATLTVFSTALFAQRPLLSIVETVDINAPPAVVWQKIRGFNDMPSWHPAIADSQIISGTDNEQGAARLMQVKDGPALTDELISLHDDHMVFIYRLVESPFPLTDYLSTVTVKPRGQGSEVIWTVTFRRKNAADNPPMEESDSGAISLFTGVYRGGLDNLKSILEQ